MPTYVDIGNAGTIHILGTLRTEGFSEGSAVNNTGIIEVSTAGRFESLLVYNASTITNTGITYLNRYQDESAIIGSPGAYVGYGGMWNYGTFNNNGGTLNSQGFLDNYGTLTNGANATFLSSTNDNNSICPYQYTSIFTNYGTFTNNGQAEVAATSRLINGDGLLFVTLNNSRNLISNGQLTNKLRGTLQNDGSLASNGLFTNQGTVLNSGVITQHFGQLTNSGHGTIFRNTGSGAILNNDSATLLNQQGAVLQNFGALNNVNSSGPATLWNDSMSFIDNRPGATLTNSESLINDGQIFNDGEIHNSGMFNSGGTLTGSGTYTQTAGKTRVDGSVEQTAIYLNGGILSGGGTINTHPLVPGGPIPPGVYINGGTIAPGDPVTLTIDGDLHFNTGILDIQIAGPQDFDRLVVTGSAQFSAGTIQFDFINGYLPHTGDLIEFVTVPTVTVDASHFNLAYTGLADGFEFQVSPAPSGLDFLALNDGVAPGQVPEPATLWWFGSALGGLLLRRHRKPVIAFWNVSAAAG